MSFDTKKNIDDLADNIQYTPLKLPVTDLNEGPQGGADSNVLWYNYYSTPFYKSQILHQSSFDMHSKGTETNGMERLLSTSSTQKDLKKGGIKVPYSSKENQPNIFVLGNEYLTKTLSIVKPIHTIDNKEYDAELIIEHLPLTNFAERLFTCFLLKTKKGVYNDLDDLIGGRDCVLTLNRYITPQKTVVYENNGYLESSLVIIFTEIIYVDSEFEELQSGTISLTPYVDSYSLMNANPVLGGLPKALEGMTSNTTQESSPVVVAGYCQPIDETDPTIAETSGVIIPMDSKVMGDNATNTTLKTMMNFFGFFIMVIIAVMVTPIAHKIFIVELIMDNKDEFSSQQLLNRANAADIYTGAIIFGFSLAFINYGMLNNATVATIVGMYVFVFFITSVIILQYYRIFKTDEYLQQFKGKDGGKPNFNDIEMDWGLIQDNIMTLFFQRTMEPNTDPATKNTKPEIPVYHFQFGFLVVLLFYLVFLLILHAFNLTKKMGSFFYTSLNFYGVTFGIYMRALINHYRLQTSKTKSA